MIREIFLGYRLSDFRFNAVVKAFIASEMFLWSSWNFVIPIFPIFAASTIPGGNVALAAAAYSTYLITRLIFDIISSRFLLHSTELDKFLITILGICLVSIAYLGFSVSYSIVHIFFFYGIAGIGVGIGYPAKLSLFSTHLDKDKETVEWSIEDTIVITGTALAASLGGLIATEYSFQLLFIIASIICFLGTLPYILYIQSGRKHYFIIPNPAKS